MERVIKMPHKPKWVARIACFIAFVALIACGYAMTLHRVSLQEIPRFTGYANYTARVAQEKLQAMDDFQNDLFNMGSPEDETTTQTVTSEPEFGRMQDAMQLTDEDATQATESIVKIVDGIAGTSGVLVKNPDELGTDGDTDASERDTDMPEERKNVIAFARGFAPNNVTDGILSEESYDMPKTASDLLARIDSISDDEMSPELKDWVRWAVSTNPKLAEFYLEQVGE